MKAILEFNLPDDQVEYDLANNGRKFWSVLWELDQDLRAKTKYAPDDLPQDKYEAYQEVRDKLYELMSEDNISFDIVK
jgi:vacuolar-type H+-ATPase catalytic subunit A/Vma1